MKTKGGLGKDTVLLNEVLEIVYREYKIEPKDHVAKHKRRSIANCLKAFSTLFIGQSKDKIIDFEKDIDELEKKNNELHNKGCDLKKINKELNIEIERLMKRNLFQRIFNS